MIALNNSDSGIKLLCIAYPRVIFNIDRRVSRRPGTLLFSPPPLRRGALSFSLAAFIPPRSAFEKRIYTSPRLPVLARVKQRGAHPREFHEIQKKTANPFSRFSPFRRSQYPQVILRQKSVIRSQAKIVTAIIVIGIKGWLTGSCFSSITIFYLSSSLPPSPPFSIYLSISPPCRFLFLSPSLFSTLAIIALAACKSSVIN